MQIISRIIFVILAVAGFGIFAVMPGKSTAILCSDNR